MRTGHKHLPLSPLRLSRGAPQRPRADGSANDHRRALTETHRHKTCRRTARASTAASRCHTGGPQAGAALGPCPARRLTAPRGSRSVFSPKPAPMSIRSTAPRSRLCRKAIRPRSKKFCCKRPACRRIPRRAAISTSATSTPTCNIGSTAFCCPTASRAFAVSTPALQLMTLVTGALPAQYGLRTSGVVDIDTREPRQRRRQHQPLRRQPWHGPARVRLWREDRPTGVLRSGKLTNILASKIRRSYDAIHDLTRQEKFFGLSLDSFSVTGRLSLISGTSMHLRDPQ